MEMRDMETIKELKKSKKKILIYGTGYNSESVFEYLYKHNLSAEAFIVDLDYFKPNKMICGIPLKKITDFYEDMENYNVVIGFCDADKTKAILALKPILKTQLFFLFKPDLRFMWEWDEAFWRENRTTYNELINTFADKKSREVFLGWIKAKSGGDITDLLLAASSDQYFNELTFTAFPESEVFVDCGAYDGDTILKYAAFTEHRYKKVIAFEPEHSNALRMTERTKNLHNIKIIEAGVWKETTELSFLEDGINTQVSDDGKTMISVTSIDDALSNENVTFIKMDIEGTEQMALYGAAETIRRCHPKLAICVYHLREDIVEIFKLIKLLDVENKYRFFLRHHTNGAYETVLYAIPKEGF